MFNRINCSYVRYKRKGGRDDLCFHGVLIVAMLDINPIELEVKPLVLDGINCSYVRYKQRKTRYFPF